MPTVLRSLPAHAGKAIVLRDANISIILPSFYQARAGLAWKRRTIMNSDEQWQQALRFAHPRRRLTSGTVME
jgi:hypothetical protein